MTTYQGNGGPNYMVKGILALLAAGVTTIVVTTLTVTTLTTSGRTRLGNGTAMGQPAGTPSAVDSGVAGNVNGTVRYAYYEIDPSGSGKTTLSAYAAVTVTNKQVDVTVPLPRRGAGGRVLCRTKNGDTSVYYVLQSFGGDYYTTFRDNVADGSLGAAVTNTDTTTLYRLDMPSTGVMFHRTHPSEGTDASDVTLLTGDPATASNWGLDSYATIVARAVSSGNPNAFYARCYGTAASNIAFQVENLDAAYGSAASTNYVIYGDGSTTSNSTATWTIGDCNFKITPANGDFAYVGPTTNSGIYWRTNNTARVGLTADGTVLYPVSNGTMSLGDATHKMSGVFTNGQVVGLTTKVTGDSPYTATSSDYVILCNTSGGSITVNLPAAASHAGRVYVIKKINASNTVTVDPNSSETVDGAATLSWTTNYQSYNLVSDGSNWHVW